MKTGSQLARYAFALALSSLAVGCGSARSTSHPLPCSEVGGTTCGTACTSDSMCGTGLYCSGGGTCEANCIPGGTTCGTSKSCDSTGHCVNDNVVCPAGLKCNVSCSGGTQTTVTGKVYDPAGKNGLYNITVYVPGAALEPLPKGVVTGADACSCSALFTSGSVVSTSTAEDGSFTLENAPVGTFPLVLQIGKWRRVVHITTTACTTNAQPDKSLTLPSTVPAGDTDDNIPDIAVSTGAADSLECLLLRVGLPASEYVAGVGTPGGGHIHIFSGGNANDDGFDDVGIPEETPMAGAPASYTALWQTQAQLMPYDIVLLSCEGGETYNANPPALESYLNAGGRVFASHYHYTWFSGPLGSQQSYTAPADWGNNLAAWTADGTSEDDGDAIGGIISTTLNGSTTAFPKGVSLGKFLQNTNSLGQGGVAANELSIYSPRYDAVVSTMDAPSQAWITSDATGVAGSTMYFSFNTPVMNAPVIEGTPTYCGRAVYSDLHVDGDPNTNDEVLEGTPPPQGCDNTDLSPQEKALEFMLFDLSSCVIPDTVAPPPGIPIQ